MQILDTLRKALEALEWCVEQGGGPTCEHESGGAVCFCKENAAITALRAEIERLEAAEPVAARPACVDGRCPDRRECDVARACLHHTAPAKPTAAEPVAYMWQHDETGRIGFIDPWQLQNGFEANNPRCKIVCPLTAAPIAPSIPALTEAEVRAMWGTQGHAANWAYALAAERAGVQIK